MLNNLPIHALLEERASHAHGKWSIEHAQSLPTAAKPFFRIHLDLQMGPFFITIGQKMVNHSCSHTQFVKETA